MRQPDEASSDDVLVRADALLARHRNPASATPSSAAAALLIDAAEAHAADIPTLTDIVISPTSGPAAAQPAAAPAPAADKAPVAPEPQWPATPGPAPAPQPEVISRVQTQNLEHSVYLKLKQELDEQIANVVHERFMPEIGAALDQALQKVTREMGASINVMVRSSIEEALQLQIRSLRLAIEDKVAQPKAIASGASAIMPPPSESPPALQ